MIALFLIVVSTVQPLQASTAAPLFTLSPTSAAIAQCESFGGFSFQSTGGAISSYSVSPVPPRGMTFNSATGVLSGRPEVSGITYFTVTGSNSAGSYSRWFNLTVTEPTAKGIYPVCQNVAGTVGQPITTSTFSDIEIGEYNFTVTPTLPSGLTLNLSTGVISGVPSAALASTEFTLQMDEEDTSWTSFVTVTLTIAAAPTITTTSTTSTTVVAPTTIAPTTIRCAKGSKVRKISGISPRCPKGFKRIRR